MTTTHTFATLDVSPACYEEIKKRLEVVGQPERIDAEGQIDMNGIALVRETDERMRVYITFEGKKL